MKLLLGLLIGIAIGVGATLLLTGGDDDTPAPPPRQGRPASPRDAPWPPVPGAMPPGAGHGAAGAGHGEGAVETSFAKVHFMRKFVAALTEPPKNLMPSTDYAPLMKEGAAALRCADCHTDQSIDFEGMISADPGDEAVQPLRMQRRGFMIPLMEKWVARLNTRHADRLRKEVTCTDCHAVDPRDDEARFAVIPPLMIRFVRALKEPPVNQNPAKGWIPLLKDPSAPSMLCATCHGQTGAAMEKNLASFDRPPRPEALANRAFMINLMERWVREVNRKMKDQLVKAVSCTDCHEIDPRK